MKTGICIYSKISDVAESKGVGITATDVSIFDDTLREMGLIGYTVRLLWHLVYVQIISFHFRCPGLFAVTVLMYRARS